MVKEIRETIEHANGSGKGYQFQIKGDRKRQDSNKRAIIPITGISNKRGEQTFIQWANYTLRKNYEEYKNLHKSHNLRLTLLNVSTGDENIMISLNFYQ